MFNGYEFALFLIFAGITGFGAGLMFAAWLAGRDPTTDRRGTGHAPGPGNPALDELPPPNPPRLSLSERRRYRN